MRISLHYGTDSVNPASLWEIFSASPMAQASFLNRLLDTWLTRRRVTNGLISRAPVDRHTLAVLRLLWRSLPCLFRYANISSPTIYGQVHRYQRTTLIHQSIYGASRISFQCSAASWYLVFYYASLVGILYGQVNYISTLLVIWKNIQTFLNKIGSRKGKFRHPCKNLMVFKSLCRMAINQAYLA